MKGGKRPNSGRKTIYSDPVELTINITCDRSQAEQVMESVRRLRASYRMQWAAEHPPGPKTLTGACEAEITSELDVVARL